jgi:O-antigen ligase
LPPKHALAPEAAPAAAREPMTARAAELIVKYGVAAYVLLLPLEFTAMLFRQQLSRFVLLVVGAAFLYLLGTHRRTLVIPRSLSAWLLGVFVAASIASWVLTRSSGSLNSLVDIVAYPVAAVLIANIVLTDAEHRRTWIALLVSGLIVSAVGAVLYVMHGQIWAPNPAVANRMNITFADPNITARFLTLCACACVLMYSARQGSRLLAMASAVACGAVLPLTFSRSGLALFVAMVLFAVLVAFDQRRAAAIGAIALVAFAGSTMINPATRSRAEQAVATVTGLAATSGGSHAQTSAAQGASALDDNRRYLIAAGLTMFKDHPILGVGFGGYQKQILTTYRRFLPSGYTDSVSHTSLVTVMAEQGLVGLVLFLLFLVQFAREAIRVRLRAEAMAFWATVPAAVVVPIFLYSQFEARFVQEPYLWLALGLFYGARQAALGKDLSVPVTPEPPARRPAEAA